MLEVGGQKRKGKRTRGRGKKSVEAEIEKHERREERKMERTEGVRSRTNLAEMVQMVEKG